MLQGKVFLTGGAGFLGRAIIAKAKAEQWPCEFTVYSRDEAKQFDLTYRYPGVKCILGNVSTNLERLIAAMTGHDIVIHAAAVKFIPEAEHNVFEAIETNITGSQNVALAAIAAGVKAVVGVSTDKACAPLNLYGMTKAVMERMFAEANRMAHGRTSFVTVRYGNVVGSTGSVIPVFKRQIADSGEIRITDPRMTRFWLSPSMAVDLVTYAANHAEGLAGNMVIDPCPAMTISDLAAAVWDMEYPEDVPNIITTGIRPGEKLAESLFNEQESPRVYTQDDYFIMRPATEPAAYRDGGGYSSDNPRQWVSIKGMQTMIREAALI